MTYCFLCPNCRVRATSTSRDPQDCPECGTVLLRDYRSEAAGIGGGVRASRDTREMRATHAYSQWAERASEAEGL